MVVVVVIVDVVVVVLGFGDATSMVALDLGVCLMPKWDTYT